MLEIRGLDTGYGKKQVVFSVSLEVRGGEIIALIGPNGAGKSTLLKAVCGLIPAWKGDIRFNGLSTNGWTPAQTVARGIAFAPQGNRVFADMTVMENLEVGGYVLRRREAKARIEHVLDLFPVLKERFRKDAGDLSGGEQQLVALARALVPKPRLLMLDEPSLGLAPNLVVTVFSAIARVNQDTGTTILVVEQRVHEVLEICDKVYSMKLGKIAFEGAPDQLKSDKEKLRDLFL